ncbi:MAG: 5-(carboxyamino)imidazole ribonucleotide mutase [Planctomycetes bacterium]|nr:5-(carboxyamino)imidazole ribonucleotide mutase [Planctomycetota bacterium]
MLSLAKAWHPAGGHRVSPKRSPPPLVAIVLGSDSDMEAMQPCLATLKEFGVAYELRVISAHRTPDAAHDYAKSAAERGLRVIIAAAGGAAHLPGVLASLTPLPVIGVPMPTSLAGGLDSLLSIVQMPSGIPVATVAVGKAGPVNAAILAAQILAEADAALRGRIVQYKARLAERVAIADENVRNPP